MRPVLSDLTLVFDKVERKIMLGRRNHKNGELCLDPKPVDFTTEAVKAVACYCAGDEIISLHCPNGEKLRLSLVRDTDDEER